jgi:[protein-PII] uridylyltransferase
MPSDLGISRDELAGLRERLAHRSPILSSPRDVLRQHAEAVDGLVRRAFLKAHGEGPLPSACLVAVGGYGRSELAPGSDVDLLLLYAPARQEGLPGLIEKTLYPLWDLGLEVSCSSRPVEECLQLARADPSVRTGLMDSRYLDGDYDLFRRLHDLFGRKVLHRGVRDFAQALLTEILQRHQRFEDPAYVLEPDIKEGKGGLRDFQIGRWIIRSRYKTDRWESILFPEE